MKKYERVAGHVTRGETFAKLNETLIEAEELCAVMGHLHETEDTDHDRFTAKGWRGCSELLHRMRVQIIKLAQGKLQ